MIAIDTNVLVRFLTNDDKKQAAFAANLIEAHSVFIPKSVLLETEWVLRFTYEFEADEILMAFEKLLSISNITVENLACVLQTLKWYREKFDFADALHLASSYKADKFATLDKAFIKKARKLKINFISMSEK